MAKRMKKGTEDSQSSSSPSSNSSSSNLFIPECILMEILCRLPAKSLVRCKCLSKRWLYLISHPSLIGRYQSLHPNNAWNFIHYRVGEKLGFEFNNNPELVGDYKSSIFSVISVIPFSKLEDSELEIAASSNGLLLCKELMFSGVKTFSRRSRKVCYFWIFNPVTLQFVKLPRINGNGNTLGRFGCEGFLTLVDMVGAVVSYKVVRLLSGFLQGSVHKFQVFSSEEGKWERFDVYFPQHVVFSSMHRPVVYNGILHWVGHSNEDNNLVIAYDPYIRAEWCRVFAFPSGNKMHTCFGLVRGHLGCVLMDNFSIDLHNISKWTWKLWTLKDYDKGEWSLEYNFSSNPLGNVFVDVYLSSIKMMNIFGPKNGHPLDSDVIYFWGESRGRFFVLSYNIRNRKLEVVNQHYRFGEGNGWFYALPFVIPSWPTVIPQPSWNQKS